MLPVHYPTQICVDIPCFVRKCNFFDNYIHGCYLTYRIVIPKIHTLYFASYFFHV